MRTASLSFLTYFTEGDNVRFPTVCGKNYSTTEKVNANKQGFRFCFVVKLLSDPNCVRFVNKKVQTKLLINSFCVACVWDCRYRIEFTFNEKVLSLLRSTYYYTSANFHSFLF